jgi:hypothetical protein
MPTTCALSASSWTLKQCLRSLRNVSKPYNCLDDFFFTLCDSLKRKMYKTHGDKSTLWSRPYIDSDSSGTG